MSKNVELFTEIAKKLEKKIIAECKADILKRLLAESVIELEGEYYIKLDRVASAIAGDDDLSEFMKGEENDN